MTTLRKIGNSLRAAGRDPSAFARGAARLPLEQQAAARIAALPVIELAELAGSLTELRVRLSAVDSRHEWSLGAAEQIVLQVLLQARGCHTAFEIGTFNGGTTRLLAESLPADGHVWTIDLPGPQFDQSQRTSDFDGSRVGEAYRESAAAHKITQILADSLSFDFSAYAQAADIVLVDAGHERPNGFTDSTTALRLVRPGGIIVWDDFEPYWHGLVNGICDAMAGRRLGRLAGTSFAVYVADPA